MSAPQFEIGQMVSVAKYAQPIDGGVITEYAESNAGWLYAVRLPSGEIRVFKTSELSPSKQ